MKVLLDECLPKKLKYELEADEATTVLRTIKPRDIKYVSRR